MEERIKEEIKGRVEECHVANVAKENCCDECIGVVIKIAALEK